MPNAVSHLQNGKNVVSSTNPGISPSLPTLSADLLLMHAPAFFDLRNRSDIYFPFLGTSGDVPITPLYEYFPIGFKMLHRHLSAKGHSVKIINLSTVLLRYPTIDVSRLIESLDVRLLGIDLHWMVHVQGSLEVAKLVKSLRPDILTIFGGISSTYYAEELVRYPFVDMVMKGYDTLTPMHELLAAVKQGKRDLSHIPNLLWKSEGGVRQNAYEHKPSTYGIGIDWTDLRMGEDSSSLPILEFLSTQNAGCAYHCGWCGGSRDAFRRVFSTKPAILRKSREELDFEFKSVQSVPGCDKFHFCAVGSYNELRSGMENFLDLIAATRLKSISYEQFFLTPEPILKRMAAGNKHTTITLSLRATTFTSRNSPGGEPIPTRSLSAGWCARLNSAFVTSTSGTSSECPGRMRSLSWTPSTTAYGW